MRATPGHHRQQPWGEEEAKMGQTPRASVRRLGVLENPRCNGGRFSDGAGGLPVLVECWSTAAPTTAEATTDLAIPHKTAGRKLVPAWP